MKKNIFKEGDLVRCINVEHNSEVKIDTIYIIDHVYLDFKKEFVDLGNYNRLSKTNGFFLYRFKKIMAGDLTPEELSSYIKYKFKIGKVI